MKATSDRINLTVVDGGVVGHSIRYMRFDFMSWMNVFLTGDFQSNDERALTQSIIIK